MRHQNTAVEMPRPFAQFLGLLGVALFELLLRRLAAFRSGLPLKVGFPQFFYIRPGIPVGASRIFVMADLACCYLFQELTMRLVRLAGAEPFTIPAGGVSPPPRNFSY